MIGTDSMRVRVELTLTCSSECVENPGEWCEVIDRYHGDTEAECMAKARGEGWMFRLGAARCPACGNAGASFGRANRGDPLHAEQEVKPNE